MRQGDHLSPYSFILAMEPLSQILLRTKEGGFISKFKVGGIDGEGQEMTHMLYATYVL